MADDPRGTPGRPIQVLLLSALGLGAVRPAPGTFASLAVCAAMWLYEGRPVGAFWLGLALLVYGVWVTLGCRGVFSDPEHADPSWVVSDEVAGQALACLAALPFGGGWQALLAAFVLFRLFDITKWGPVGRLEKVPGAKGVLLDDLAAGAMAAAIVGVAGALGAFAAF